MIVYSLPVFFSVLTSRTSSACLWICGNSPGFPPVRRDTRTWYHAPNTARSRCRWSVSGGRACGTVWVYHEPVDGASERLACASECSAARFSAAVADQNVLQPVVWQQAHGHAQLAAGVIETELAAGEGVLGLARANRPRRHVAARRGVTNMMLLQHSFIWWLSQWDGAAALPS